MRVRITPSFIVAVLALVVACTGSAWAGMVVGSQHAGLQQSGQHVTSRLAASKCPKTTTKIAGLCVDKKSTAPKSFQAANLACSGRNGRLLGESEFVILRNRILNHPARYRWADGQFNQYEFLSDWGSSANELFPQATDLGGNNFGDASAQTFHFRCVTYP
jgi:hypothetical protein